MVLKKILSGVIYTAIPKYSGVIISIIIGAVLARLLSPEEFGVVALVTVFISFFNMLSNAGIGPAVVQNKELSNEDVQSIFLFSIFLGFFLALVFFFSSSFISEFYNNNELLLITKLLSITVFFSSLKVVPNALLLKNLKFKRIGIITIVIQLFSGFFAIILAFKGYSYYALVYKSIFDSILTFLLFYWLSPIKISIRVKITALKKIIRFSSFQFMFNFINFFSRNIDNLLIGKYINPVALGLYDKSYQLMMVPVQNLTHVISPVLHPVLSEFQQDKNKIYNAYSNVFKLLASIGFPLSIFLYFTANEIISILYGVKWVQSVPVFKILSLTIGIQMVLSSSGAIFQALNRTDLLFYSGLLSAFFIICGIGYGIFFEKNIESVGYCLIAAFIINFFQGFYFLINIGFRSSFLNFLKFLCYPFFISLIVALALFFVSKINIINLYYSFTIKAIVAITLFIGLNLANNQNRKIILRLLDNFKKRRN